MTKTWNQLGKESAERENERLRQQGEASRQKIANDALHEIVTILNKIDVRLNKIDVRIARIESLIIDITRD